MNRIEQRNMIKNLKGKAVMTDRELGLVDGYDNYARFQVFGCEKNEYNTAWVEGFNLRLLDGLPV